MRATLRLLADGIRAALLLRPAGVAAALAPPLLFVAIAWHLAFGIALDWLQTEAPAVFDPWVIAERSVAPLLALAGALLAAHAIGRPALWLRLAALGLLAALPAQALWQFGVPTLELAGRSVSDALIERAWAFAALLAYAALVIARLLRWAGASPVRAWPLAALLAPALLLPSLLIGSGSSWWWSDPPQPDAAAPPWLQPRDYSAEQLLYAQPELLDAAVQRIAPGTPGAIELFALGFAGDGSEGVFRNEIEHLELLMRERAGAPQRTLALINHPQTIDTVPLATLTNLRRALAGLGARMDRDEDILLLYLTTHGSPEHELFVGLHDLPLDPVDPPALRDALDAAGIRWRVIVVSACYSGGFIDALRDPHTLVLTAARDDRPSFGCGVTSEITWFGQAWLVDGLNTTLDFVAAFERAAAQIQLREEAEGETPSHPQIAAGERILDRLERWRAQAQPGPAVDFVPAVPAPPLDDGAEP